MRVALLTSFFPPDDQFGIARYIEDMAFALIEKGCDVTVIAAGSSDYAIEHRGKLTIHWVKKDRRRKKSSLSPSLSFIIASLQMYFVLRKLHILDPFDIIEYPNTEINGLACLLFRLPVPTPLKIIRMATPRSFTAKSYGFPRLTSLLEYWQAKFSDAYISHSAENLKNCEKIYNLNFKKPTCVILLGLPEKKNVSLKPVRNNIDIFFLGRMNKRKGFDILASAWPKISETFPNSRLIVAGEDLPFKNETSFFQWAVKDINPKHQKKIIYYGSIKSSLKEELYENSYLLAVPSRYESFGLVLLEAMQHGLPTVSSNIGGIPEIIKHGETGLLVTPDNSTALADAIILLLKDREMYEKISTSLKNELSERFTIERVAKETIAFYLQLKQVSK